MRISIDEPVRPSVARRARAGMNSAEIRACAARLVAKVAHDGSSLDALLAAESALPISARGAVRALCYETLRWWWRLAAILGQLLDKPKRPLAPEIHALALIGACQLLYMRTPAHAAVAETVAAARVLGQPQATGLINAVLRRLQREAATITRAVDQDLATRTAHPSWFVEALQRDWPADYAAILDANNGHPPFWLRVNQRRVTTAVYRERLAAMGIESVESPIVPEALLLERAVDVMELPGFAEGDASVQDAGAQLAAHVVAPRRGERILDACAAPGGKTAHLLELQPELAELVAIDSSAERLQRVRENLHRLGLGAKLLEADAAALAQWWDGRPFDRVLLDVPCSATGVIRRHPDVKLLRRQADIPRFAAQQVRLLEQVWQVLATGGRLVYASCSVLEPENAAVIAGFLHSHPEATDETAQVMAALGLRTQSTPGHKFAPMTAGMDGFYYACLVKATKVT